jgi:hypothetical protein
MKLAVRNKRRDLEIVFLRENKKWLFSQIAEKYSISKARARQLYMRMVHEKMNVNKEMGIGA